MLRLIIKSGCSAIHRKICFPKVRLPNGYLGIFLHLGRSFAKALGFLFGAALWTTSFRIVFFCFCLGRPFGPALFVLFGAALGPALFVLFWEAFCVQLFLFLVWGGSLGQLFSLGHLVTQRILTYFPPFGAALWATCVVIYQGLGALC